jgi:hypothetical protein
MQQSLITGFNIYCNFCQKPYPGCNTCRKPVTKECIHGVCVCEVAKPVKEESYIRKHKARIEPTEPIQEYNDITSTLSGD